ncbi:protein-export chaperone SecB [Gluconobacter morbifer]|uniref:Protein translocase subunit SecB n=1 Tax=Gluconobacter morbifer G707 TaxID=1088869 RepID=G6XIU1_9PROT|nr:protein-export chaperone SecB [Gluconobacter morbifer]EHH68267.1 protein translocase subunit SecB [Gluconobacter morbifer G707]
MDNAYTDTVTGSSDVEGVKASPAAPPRLVVGSQYLRSLAIDIQNTPDVYFSLPPQPHIAMMVDVTARQLGEQPNFEVSLVIRAQGLEAAPTQEAPSPKVLYEINASYAGLFGLSGLMSEADVEPMLLVQAPGFLFPSSRAVILSTVREAGFPVANIQPIDFHALWQSRRAQQR